MELIYFMSRRAVILLDWRPFFFILGRCCREKVDLLVTVDYSCFLFGHARDFSLSCQGLILFKIVQQEAWPKLGTYYFCGCRLISKLLLRCPWGIYSDATLPSLIESLEPQSLCDHLWVLVISMCVCDPRVESLLRPFFLFATLPR